MKVLVANLGSTSFKYRLYDMTDERQLARGGIERIGAAESCCFVETSRGRQDLKAQVPDHAAAVRRTLDQLTDPEIGCLKDASEVEAIGFKAVHGGRLSGVQIVNPAVLEAMEGMCQVAPAHNPAYIAAMRLLREKLPEVPLVAAFETGFHQTIPERNQYYPVPWEWAEKYNVRRFGFHGRAIATSSDDRRTFGSPRPARHLVPPRRVQLSVRGTRRREPGHVHGPQPAVRRVPQQPGGGFRSLRPADPDRQDRQDARATAGGPGRAERAAWTERRERRRARLGAGGRRWQRPGAAGARRLRGRHSQLFRSAIGRTRRSRRDRVYRRHRRERPEHSHRGLREPGGARHRARRGFERRRQRRSADQLGRQPDASVGGADE